MEAAEIIITADVHHSAQNECTETLANNVSDDLVNISSTPASSLIHSDIREAEIAATTDWGSENVFNDPSETPLTTTSRLISSSLCIETADTVDTVLINNEDSNSQITHLGSSYDTVDGHER